jgi:hypothetical protein
MKIEGIHLPGGPLSDVDYTQYIEIISKRYIGGDINADVVKIKVKDRSREDLVIYIYLDKKDLIKLLENLINSKNFQKKK